MFTVKNIKVSVRQKRFQKELINVPNLTLHQGEFTALIGPNGAGKTTLLNCLAGDLIPTTGEVLLAGKPLNDYSISELAYRRSVLPQTQHIPFAINVRAVLLMGVMPFEVSYRDSRVIELLETICSHLELSHLLDQTYQTLSGGEQHRAQIGRVLMQALFACDETPYQPRVLLLDEPFNHLDLYHQQKLLRYLKELKTAGMTIICVMHDLNQALQSADRLVLMARGTLHGVYTPDELRESTLLNEVFGVDFITLYHPDNAEISALSYLLS